MLVLTVASPGAQIVSRDPALVWAARHGLRETVELLIAAGVDVNQRDMLGNSALHAAARHPELIEFLITKGAEVDARNFLGETPLHMAVRFHRSVEILLAHGADRNARNALDRTPLDYSMEHGTSRRNQAIIRLLVEG